MRRQAKGQIAANRKMREQDGILKQDAHTAETRGDFGYIFIIQCYAART